MRGILSEEYDGQWSQVATPCCTSTRNSISTKLVAIASLRPQIVDEQRGDPVLIGGVGDYNTSLGRTQAMVDRLAERRRENPVRYATHKKQVRWHYLRG